MSGENDYQVFDLNRAPGADIDAELKKIQLIRERLALEDELRKREQKARATKIAKATAKTTAVVAGQGAVAVGRGVKRVAPPIFTAFIVLVILLLILAAVLAVGNTSSGAQTDAQADQPVPQAAQAQQARDEGADNFEQARDRVERLYPVLNPTTPQYSAQVVRGVQALLNKHLNEGMAPTTALRQSVYEVCEAPGTNPCGYSAAPAAPVQQVAPVGYAPQPQSTTLATTAMPPQGLRRDFLTDWNSGNLGLQAQIDPRYYATAPEPEVLPDTQKFLRRIGGVFNSHQ
ncbi:MAG: hypothetical protein LBU72_03925 [Burkholderiaceae bacterium]|jgi:predicted small secreted protein|nr:hypothetical protein [Burkholderiaceae bacterium]